MKYFLKIFSLFYSLCYAQNFPKYIEHECIRSCCNTEPMTCEYNFTLETYSTLSRACYSCPKNLTDCSREDCIAGDGTVKTIEVVNRQFPGPYIQVCKGDTVIVNVHNKQRSQRVASIHWHGLKQQNASYMDGVGMITQWPILPYTSFQYKFKAQDSGTHFWHGSSGIQRTDGIFGPLIIREKDDPLSKLYDLDKKEHYMILNEWHRNPLMSIYGSYLHDAYFGTEYSILINGKGSFPEKANISVPLEIFHVKQGFKYRFRLISSAGENCIMKVSIDEHLLTIIASDGHPVDPLDVNSITLLAGERYDFVLNANNQESDYWIKVKGEGNCGFKKLFQKAILRYENSKNCLNSSVPLTYEEVDRNGTEFRSIYDTKQNIKTYSDLRSNKEYKIEFLKRISQKPDRKLYLNYDLKLYNDPEVHNSELYPFNNSNNTWHSSFINDIKFEMPSKPPLLYWNDKIKITNLCNETHTPCSKDAKFCSCTHFLDFKLNELVEFVLIDGNSFFEKHTIYLHGYDFAVVGIGKLKNQSEGYLSNKEVQKIDSSGKLKRNFNRPLIKDTVSIPRGGYTIIRFVTDNPGFWMFHCHIESHSDPGMSILIKVGNFEDMRKPDDNSLFFN